MELREYLFRRKLSVTEFGKQIDYSRTRLSKIVNGGKPSKKLARAIERATNGEVSVKELLGEESNHSHMTDGGAS